MLTALALTAALCGCTAKPATAAAPGDAVAERGTVSADSIMQSARTQCGFGPRVPGSEAHDRCREWLCARLEALGADTVMVMGTPEILWDGRTVPVHNIYARFGAGRSARVLLMAHYDTRPWADSESDASRAARPIDGANDGASGVAVILEVLRNLGTDPADVGVDVLLTDLEDSGTPPSADVSEGWCLGAEQFARELPYTADTLPRYGILLDMVGGRDARFAPEYFSSRGAPLATGRVWATARRLGLDGRFGATARGAVTDDHLPLIRAGIQVTDIIECSNPETGSFPPTWHTLDDNIDNLDPATMADVARVVLNTIYNEKP